MNFLNYDDKPLGYRFAWFVGKSFRSLWIVFLTIVLVITVLYGIVLNTFDSQGIAVALCALLLGLITFFSMVDIREEKDKFSNANKKSGRKVSRASSKNK